MWMLVNVEEDHCQVVGGCICSCNEKCLDLVDQIIDSDAWFFTSSIFLPLHLLKDELN